MLSRVACVVVVALCALVADVSPSRAVGPSAAPPAGPLADGVWTVRGRAIPGRRCGDWQVRLTNAQGRLSGVLSLARSSVPIENLALLPDGSFSGATQAGVVGSTLCGLTGSPGGFPATRSTSPSKIMSARRATASALDGRQPAEPRRRQPF
jgi:hypothetical protein